MSLNPVARLSYLLASEPKLAGLIYKQLANTGFFSMIYFSELFIDLKFNDGFSLKKIFGMFLNDKHMNAVVKNIKLSYDEKELMKQRIYEKFPLVEYKGIVLCWAMADMIKRSKRPFVFMPMVLNYGKDKNLSHQTALIYDKEKRKLIFYEPYGSYEKYGKSYKSTLYPLNYILLGSVGVVETFHDFYQLGIGTQTMIINQNNKNVSEYVGSLASIKKRYDALTDEGWRQPKPENKKFDVTIESMRILDDVEDVALGVDRDLLGDAYYLFYKFSAKTCVTLTFVDMFFMSRHGKKILHRFYKDVETQKHPSEFLINTFGSILVKIYNKKFVPVLRKLSDLGISNDELVKYLI